MKPRTRRKCKKTSLFWWPKQHIARWLFVSCMLWVFPCSAQSVTGLTIDGTTSSGIVGEFALTSQFSWFHHVIIDPPGHSWMFGPGSMGGIVFGTEQPMGEMGGWYIMYNQPAILFSAAGGITIDSNNTIDMSNLLFSQAGTVYDLGSGSGYNTLVPLVSDISFLGAGQNGWMINPDGTYYLIYNSIGLGPTSTSTVHLYGSVVAIPLPGALVTFASGIIGLLIIAVARKGGVMSMGRYAFF
ncbi:hypothetical protein [Sulfuricaulis sp.]|jgi:hypothetical protein|uniref:hypothetical protein n=1 Tax=Sulfuricaulis sp. TaxID=2003553 RepID=UPI00355A29AB